ncbi:MAG: hypothetical protein F4X51_08050 [Gemmatimonadetes bacterium]|nr:hypothetical protein [Gemmatimonadota bacterium]
MALFSEYAVTPDVFNESCYDSPALCDTYLRQLQQVFFTEGLVRDLRNGEWQAFFSTHARPWHARIKHILKNLTVKGRLVPGDPALNHTPQTDREWCNEALASHQTTPLNGIIVSDAIERTYRKNQLVESVSRLSQSTCAWWDPTNSSLRLNRTIQDYKDALKLILRHAKSIMFIDPYIDPSQRNYADFIQLIEAIDNRPSQSPRPLVEIHRKSLRVSGKNASLWDQQDMENTFRNEFGPVLSQSNLKAEVFIWDDFHDRYLISNLGGILVPYGFDTSSKPDDLTTWSRLGRSDRDDVQREFARESNKHKLHFDFMIP